MTEKVNCYDKHISLTVKSMFKSLVSKKNSSRLLSNQLVLFNTFHNGKDLHTNWVGVRNLLHTFDKNLSVCLGVHEFSTPKEKLG